MMETRLESRNARLARDRRLVIKCADKIGLRLKEEPNNYPESKYSPELIFEAYRGKKVICIIDKLRDKPRFRITAFLTVNIGYHDFYKSFHKTAGVCAICSINLISWSACPDMGNYDRLSLSFAVGIHREGFNEVTLKDAIKSVEDCRKEIKAMLHRQVLLDKRDAGKRVKR